MKMQDQLRTINKPLSSGLKGKREKLWYSNSKSWYEAMDGLDHKSYLDLMKSQTTTLLSIQSNRKLENCLYNIAWKKLIEPGQVMFFLFNTYVGRSWQAGTLGQAKEKISHNFKDWSPESKLGAT
jgi:hypothetical protein